MKTNHKLIIGILLLFIFSATFYFSQKAYKGWKVLHETIVKPTNFPDGFNETTIPSKDIITIFPIGDLKVYFEAKDKNGTLKIDSKDFVSFIEYQEKVIGKAKFTVVIKATENATYKDMVDLLDKLSALGNKRYSIAGINEEENKRVESFLNSNPQ